MVDALRKLISELPHDGRRTIVLKIVKAAIKREASEVEKQKELAAKATPAEKWLNSLKRVRPTIPGDKP